MEKLFEVATKNKYRWNYKGQLSLEDLFDLRVGVLDVIYKALNKEAKTKEEESLLVVQEALDTELSNKIEIIKYIVSIKLEEAEKSAKAHKIKDQKQLLAEVLNRKKNEAIESLSVEEIKAMMNSLEE